VNMKNAQDPIDAGSLWQVLQDLESGTPAPEQRDELMALLGRSTAARAAYLEYFEQAAILRAEAAIHAEQGILPVLEEPRHFRKIFRRSVLAAAAVLALSAIIAALIAIRRPEPERLAAKAAAETRWMVDGEMQDPDSNDLMVAEGSSVRVFSGTLKLRLKSGAAMVVPGPAEVSFPELEHPVLKHGWLWIDSGGTDEELLVETPELLVRDVGTRFGVRVRDDQLAEIHLIEGVVEVSAKHTQQQIAMLNPDETGVLIPAEGERTGLPLARDPFPDLPGLLAAPANYSTTILSQGPVGYWKLDDPAIGEIANEIPDGSTGRHGLEVIVGEAGVRPADGFRGFGDGNRSVSLAMGTEKSLLIGLDGPGGVSKKEGAVAFWIRRLPGKKQNELLWMAANDDSIGFGPVDSMHTHLTASGKVGFFIENGRYDVLISSDRSVVDGHWHHIVASWSPSAVELYIDGEQVARDDDFRILQNGRFSGRNVRFGKTTSTAFQRRLNLFTGWADEIALWNRPLTSYEVRHQFRSARGQERDGK